MKSEQRQMCKISEHIIDVHKVPDVLIKDKFGDRLRYDAGMP